MLTTVKQRLKFYIKSKNITDSEFCRTIDVSSGFIGSMVKSIQPDKIERITLKYPDLNIGWLMTGEGAMLKPPLQPSSRNVANTYGANNLISQMSDLVIGEGLSNIGNRSDAFANKQTSKISEDYNRRISEMGEKYNTLLLSKNELIQEKDERIKELKNQIEQLNKMIKLLCEK